MEATKEILARLDALGAKLETTGAALWQAAVQYQVAQGKAALFIGVVASVLFLTLGLTFIRSWRKLEKADRYSEDQQVVGCIIFGIATAVALLVAATNFYNATILLSAPEGAALASLLGRG